ncbi:MAG: VOC family protein [Spirochaetaceae bacterium]|nr:VOC family protein [Myxococcales bacterium]MCB9726685.1 VOC family protein [Spirochaetaceae bacterium]HPG27284.1 VOC family protein [Myxococcota bacterium]
MSTRGATKADWAIESLFHFTVNATNFERSLAFYTTLGFRVLRDNRDVIWPDYVARQFGMERAQGRGALLAIDDGPGSTRLDLLEWLDPVWPGEQVGRPRADFVPRIIALRTKNVRAAYDDLRRRGIEFVSEVRGPDEATGIEAVVCARDPDGLLVELIEYAPGVLGSRIDALARRDPGDAAGAMTPVDRSA